MSGTVSDAWIEHANAAIKAFIVPTKRARFLGFISKPRLRHKFIRELCHSKHWDWRFIKPIPPRQSYPGGISAILKGMGAGKTCWVISDWERIDDQEMELEDALRDTVGMQMGTILSCVPGKLVYFEDEDERFVLVR